MLTKIQYFPTFDSRTDITQPLSDVLALDSVFIERNGSKTLFSVFGSISEASATFPLIDFSAFADISQNAIVVAPLFTDEALSLVGLTYTVSASIETIVNSDGSHTITLTSEDRSKSMTIRLIKDDLGSATALPFLYSIESRTGLGTADSLTIPCRIFQPESVTDNTNTLNVGTIQLPLSYSTVNDPGQVDAPSLFLVSSIDSAAYIAETLDDPDGDKTVGDASTLTVVSGVTFSGAEVSLLDANFVHLKLTKGSSSIYYKLTKNQDYNTEIPLNRLKALLSDKYVYWLKDTYAVPAENISTTQAINVSRQKTVTDTLSYLNTNSISFANVDGYYNDLVDTTVTNQVQSFSTQTAYNVLFNNPQSHGFIDSDIDNMGKVIAQVMYDVISTKTDSLNLLVYPATTAYLACIAGISCPSDPAYFETATKSDISDDLKAAYLEEAATSTFLFTNFNNRYFEWIQSRLDFIITQIESELVTYEASLIDIRNMSVAFTQLQQVNNIQTVTTPAYIETFVSLFFTQLNNLKLKADVVQRITF